jgi:hypothetical protein
MCAMALFASRRWAISDGDMERVGSASVTMTEQPVGKSRAPIASRFLRPENDTTK